MTEIGKTYMMTHRWFGRAVVRCVKPYHDGGEFEILKGTLHGIQGFWGPGDVFTAVNNLATFEEMPGK